MSNDAASSSQPEIVELVTSQVSENGLARWSPTLGAETSTLLDHQGLPTESRNTVLRESMEILGSCVPPTDGDGQDIGLIIGYVQSGKTLSFTTVAALAHDNGYQVVIVLAGTSTSLLGQSEDHLSEDLQLGASLSRNWKHFSNPSPRGADGNSIASTLEDWRDTTVARADCRTVLITVMKNRTRLNNLIQVLSRLDLTHVPILVIDDEADQAGLNTRVRLEGEQRSAVYQSMEALRRLLPQHTFLQYTATPQAPLLINLIDVLSPRFVYVLTPGTGYVGGKEFFVDHPNLVCTIPENEIPTDTQRLNEPPHTLIYAMQIFFLGVAAGLLEGTGPGNEYRSMMVHPSQRTASHAQYLRWVSQIIETWRTTLTLNVQDQDRRELLADFGPAYEELRGTVQNLPTFEQLSSTLLRAIRSTRVDEVNARAGTTPRINWRADYGHVLVGGQAMDRGFTVKGLTVTYMPRSLGVANADTVQQRARFFGYKQRYIGYCRVFLPSVVRDAYRQYVTHEEDVRTRLIEHRNSGRSMSAWKREFLLTARLRPTRHNVLGLDYMRIRLGNDWYAPEFPHEGADAVQSNRLTVQSFLDTLSLVDDPGDPRRTEMQKHKVATGVSLQIVYEQLLTALRITNIKDTHKWIPLLLQLSEYLADHHDAPCAVYYMSDGKPRERSLGQNGEIENIFQGANPSEPGPKQGSIYPGDREIKQGVTIQIHRLNVLQDRRTRQIVADDVPVVAVWLPSEVASDMVLQNQGGS